jgi:hypothetical protein
MRIFNQHLLLSLLIGTSCTAAQANLFEEMLEEMNEMHVRFEQHMSQFHEQMKKAFVVPMSNGISSPSLIISENKDNNCVEVILHPMVVKEKIFDATMDEDTNSMTVSTPIGSVFIQTDDNLICVEFNHNIKQEQDEEGNTAHIMMSSYYQNTAVVSAELALEQSHIEYDETTQKLVISIPFKKKVVTKIPVTIKETESK